MYIDIYCNDAEKIRKVYSKANGKIPEITTVPNDDIVDVSSVELD